MVENFDKFLVEGECFGMLSRWCPEKLVGLVRDGMDVRIQKEKALEKAIEDKERRLKSHFEAEKCLVWGSERDQVSRLVSQHCKAVQPKFYRRLMVS